MLKHHHLGATGVVVCWFEITGFSLLERTLEGAASVGFPMDLVTQ